MWLERNSAAADGDCAVKLMREKGVRLKPYRAPKKFESDAFSL
jgi:hypothetical protein